MISKWIQWTWWSEENFSCRMAAFACCSLLLFLMLPTASIIYFFNWYACYLQWMSLEFNTILQSLFPETINPVILHLLLFSQACTIFGENGKLLLMYFAWNQFFFKQGLWIEWRMFNYTCRPESTRHLHFSAAGGALTCACNVSDCAHQDGTPPCPDISE